MANVRGWPVSHLLGFVLWFLLLLVLVVGLFVFPLTTSLLLCCFLFFIFPLAKLIPEQVPPQSGHPVVKIYVGIVFLLKLPVSLWLIDRSERNYWWECVSALAHVSHASVIWAVVKPGNTMVLSLAYEEIAKHKGELLSSFRKQNTKLEWYKLRFFCKSFLFPVAMGSIISCHKMQTAEIYYFSLSRTNLFKFRFGFPWSDRKRMGWREAVNLTILHCTARMKRCIIGSMWVKYSLAFHTYAVVTSWL